MTATIPNMADVHPDDRELVDRLAKLQRMHQQINDLRSLMPERLLQPARIVLDNPNSTSPGNMAASLSKSASQGSQEITRFKKNFRSDEMQELWQKTSTVDFPQGGDAWIVNYQALVNEDAEATATVVPLTNGDSDTSAKEDEDVVKVVREFREANPKIKAETAEGSENVFPITVVVDDITLQITVQEREGTKVFHAASMDESGKTAPQTTTEMVQCINENTTQMTFKSFLSMLVSYKDFRFKPCDRCNNIFDDNMSYALLRKTKSAPTTEATEWKALHRTCSP